MAERANVYGVVPIPVASHSVMIVVVYHSRNKGGTEFRLVMSIASLTDRGFLHLGHPDLGRLAAIFMIGEGLKMA